MSRTLTIGTGSGARTYTPESPGGLKDGFRWQLAPSGDCGQMTFTGRNDLLRGEREIAALTVAGTAWWWGVLTQVPHPDDPSFQEFSGLGGTALLAKRRISNRTYLALGLYEIVRDLVQRHRHPAMPYDPALIGDGTGSDVGPPVKIFQAPGARLDAVLTDLLKLSTVPGASWGVDRQGRVFFSRAPAPPLALDRNLFRRLPVEGEEVVTRALLRVVSAPSSNLGQKTSAVGRTPMDYRPATVVAVAEHERHAALQAEDLFSVPPGVSVTANVRPLDGVANGYDNPDNAIDGDPATYASVTAQSGGTIVVPNFSVTLTGRRVIGVRVRYLYALSNGTGALVLQLVHNGKGAQAGAQDRGTFRFPPSATPQDAVLIFPPSGLVQPDFGDTWDSQLGVDFSPILIDGTADYARLYDIEFITVDEAVAATVAQSFLRLPYMQPEEQRVAALVAPSPTVTVTGAGGAAGDGAGPASSYDYEYSPAATSTTVRIGATGSTEDARVLRLQALGAARSAADSVRTLLESQP